MAKKRPYNQQSKLLILLLLFCHSLSSVHADGLFSSFAKRNLLIKPKNLVKGFFKSFKPFQDFPSFQQDPITQEDLLMQQAFNSPSRLLPLDSGAPPISEYLVSNFARLNPSKLKQIVGNQLAGSPMTNHFRKDQMSLSESVPHSNLFYPNANGFPSSYPTNLLSSAAPINHNLMFDQSQNVQAAPQENAGDGNYPAPSQMVNSYRSKEQESAGTSLSIGAAPGGGIGLKLGKFQMTFRKGNDGPQINLGTHDDSADDQDAENSYVSMTRARDKKKGMNIKLGKAVQFSIGGNNQDNEDRMRAGGSNVRNVISFDPARLKERILPRKSSNLMSSASENNYDESPGIQMPAITIGGSGNGRPAITIGGNSDNDDESGGGNYAAARPQITIGGGDSGNAENNGGGGGQAGGDHWNDHWNDHKRPRVYM